VSIQLTNHPWKESGSNVTVSVDLIRIAYAVMTGIGFLGAGAILQAKGSVRGLTTAAAMWSVAAVGLAAGFGLYSLTLLAAVLVVATLWLFNYVGDVLPRRRYRTVKLRGRWSENCIPNAIALFDGSDVHVVETNFHRADDDLNRVDIELRLVFTRKREYFAVERRLHQAGDFQLISSTVT
jgi:uncharacterized membrane protein YhiD involved in acid resistance